MRKKLILVGVTFAIGVGAYLVFSSGDRRARRPALTETPQSVRQFITPITSQPAMAYSDQEMAFSPGEQTRVRVYDDVSGRLKYQFEAKSWEPTSRAELVFFLKDVLVQIYTPKGEISYISADEAQITLTRKGKNRVEPKNGWLKKNVKVVVDRTTSAWREANPASAQREAHPDDLVHISLDEAHFDLEQAELHSDGPVLVDSVEARVEKVRGLTVQWNQVDGRIDVLRFQHGGMMALRRGGKMIDFAMPGAERDAKQARKAKEGATPDTQAAKPAGDLYAMKGPKAQANKPISVDAISASDAAAQIRSEGGAPMANMPRSVVADASVAVPASQPADLRDPQALASAMESLQKEARGAQTGEIVELLAREDGDKKSKRRVHTYRAVFTNKVVVEQKDGLKTIGKLEADKLELNFDFGKKQKEMAGGAPDEKKNKPPTTQPLGPRPAPMPAVAEAGSAEDSTKLVLTWDGPLELHPLRVNPEEQTGQRFDAVASGQTVKLFSEQGAGVCKQLVYRHERRQVWLAGTASAPVQLTLEGSKQLTAREVFFDQKRGLAHIEGGGTMVDDRKVAAGGSEGLLGFSTKGRGAPAGKSLSRSPEPKKEKKPQEPVRIAWSRGVDIEIGSRPVERINPATGLREQKQKEFLRRAWFHGDVDMRQGSEHLTADEVAATLGASASTDEFADHIQHLDMTGRVRLQRDTDIITANHLDAQMTVTPDGRNIPRIVDAIGDVIARQDKRVIRADQMRVTMGMVTGKGKTVVQGDMIVQENKLRVGIEALDAQGRVFVHDPDGNLKIRDAQTLKARIKDGNQLVSATIESSEPAVYAKVRAGETAIHGHQIEIDMSNESIDVPGPGAAWMITQQDFGGRQLSKPSPVKITWNREMQMRGKQNYGVFLGDVRSKSDSFSLACDKLTVRLANAPQAVKPPRASLLDQFWLTKLLRARSPHALKQTEVATTAPRKRPTYVVAEGTAEHKAEALSSTYAKSAEGLRGRLLSRLHITGQQIVADLAHERMSVPVPTRVRDGKPDQGTLLLEDYQFSESGRRQRSAVAPRSGPLMSSAQGDGPSQTLVTWKGSMDFYMDQNLVAFDKDVEMRHFSGRQMVMKEDLVAGMGMDPSMAGNLREGRRAQLTSGYLLLEFKTAPRTDAKSGGAPVRATDLERLIAKHHVHLQEDTKSLMGEYVQYLAGTNEVQIEGTASTEARIVDQDERDQRMNMWRGPILIWNRRTNAIEAPQSTIRTSRR